MPTDSRRSKGKPQHIVESRDVIAPHTVRRAVSWGFRRLAEAVFIQPKYQVTTPRVGVLERWFISQTDAVAPFLIHVQIKWDIGFAQAQREIERILHFYRGVFLG